VRAVLASLLLVGCCCGSGLAEGGPTPYVHCMQMEPPAPRDLTRGPSRLRIEGNRLDIEADAPRIALARGPAGCGEPLLPALDRIEESAPSVLVLVGDLGGGEGPDSRQALLDALAQLEIPVLLLPGGRDDGEALRAATGDEGAVVDLMGVREVRIGPLSLVPLPGAPEGRYGADDDACGFDEDDVDGLALDAAEGPRLLLSWSGPTTSDLRSVGLVGVEAGSPLVSRALEVSHAAGSLHAWPEIAIGIPHDGASRIAVGATSAALHLTLPRLLGPASEGDDGARSPSGLVVLEPSPTGVTVRGLP